jgi:outer membrane receptor protein involved in Fe transport
VDWRPVGGARLSVTAFDARLTGAIANATLFTGPGMFPGVGDVASGGVVRRRANLGAIRSRGVEVDAAARVGAWAASASGGYVDARTDAGLRPAQVAAWRAAGGVRWLGATAEAGAMLRYVGAQFDDDANRRRLRPALTLDGDVRVRLRPGVALVAAAENLFDATVEAGAAGGVIERATPRTLWVGVRLGG